MDREVACRIARCQALSVHQVGELELTFHRDHDELRRCILHVDLGTTRGVELAVVVDRLAVSDVGQPPRSWNARSIAASSNGASLARRSSTSR
jgi:hypothetical protein